MNESAERAARRYLGLAFWGLGTLLSSWAWTLAHSDYATALNDLLPGREHFTPADPAQAKVILQQASAGLGFARGWVIQFYGIDTLLYIACYLAFGIFAARQLRRILCLDLKRAGAAPVPASARRFVSAFFPVALTLLVALAAFDLGENASALTQLMAQAPSLAVAQTFHVFTTGKSILTAGATGWLVVGTMVWLMGGVLPHQAGLREVRRSVRAGIIDVLARTRYCLVAILIYAAFLLGIDQAQDVITGLARITQQPLEVALSLLAAVALGVFALHTFSHAVWVWARLLVRLRGPYQADAAAGDAVITFSKWWGRFLGAAPWFIVLTLCVRTAGSASQVGDLDAKRMLLFAGVFSTVWGLGFILWKERESRKGIGVNRPYYSSDDDEAELLRDEAYRFLGFIRKSPLWIPVVAIAGMLLVRGLYVFDVTPAACNALAGISFGFALWSSVVNRLALNSLRTRFPWILALLGVVAALASFDLTQNHKLLAGDAILRTIGGAVSLQRMFWLTVILSLVIVAAYAIWVALRSKWPAGRRASVSFAVLVIGTGTVLALGARGDVGGHAKQQAPLERQSLQSAVSDWLMDRNKRCKAANCVIPVYLISAQGGGIRAAYYAARLLGELSEEKDLDLQDRIFSLSGVSGGSLGVMSWRLCADSPKVLDCVRPLGAQDMLTPLATALMYEDVLARTIPTSQCVLPGCGFLDRASWFERALEKSLPAYQEPLPTSAPYVFLNSTWVETGERAIASNVQIETRKCVQVRQDAMRTRHVGREDFDHCLRAFPTARDQLFEIDATVRASTLAHNSARFPYFNPIGYVYKQGHLADGGYFENSGTMTTADILNEFVRQLTCQGADCPLGPEQKELADKVAITAITVRNGVRDNADPAEIACSVPRPHARQGLFSNAAGPPTTAFNATGLGTPNRVAQCNLQRVLTRLNGLLARQKTHGGYVDVRLVSEKVLYPLGWYLSPAARKGMESAAHVCVHDADGLATDLRRAMNGASAGRSLPCFERADLSVD